MNDAPKTALAPTLSDVAKLAGVSRAIASRALSAQPRPVSADKRERVLRAAETLGFRPNPLARGLASKTVNLVAILVNHIHDLSDLDLFDLLLAQIQAIGKQVIFIRIGAGEHAETFLRDGLAYHVDAALVFSDFADAGTVRRMFRNNAVLMLNGHHDAGAPSVTMDEDQGIREAVADAAAKGVRSALLLTGRTMSRVEQARIASYRTALARHGITQLGELAGDYSYASGRALAPSIDVDATDAVFCTSDAMAMGVLDAHRRHFPEHRPARFRLYGFDNVSLTQFDAYPISSIGADKRDYVAQIVRILEQPARLARVSEQVLVATRFVPRLTG
ncbi:LacI family DNA-binding transcriptional regulator [Massilia agri]|uniref:LacI family transcriptional regulator n=1 Tax=Massilia agri TaxID=1886785 RepID=A0ABT2AQS3_9BURK|nr:LacI family DNA-binding transcriptional regulator [Massilia agri]MCS0598602.1 LacI family transcriptional regulator [Massilia agri]